MEPESNPSSPLTNQPIANPPAPEMAVPETPVAAPVPENTVTPPVVTAPAFTPPAQPSTPAVPPTTSTAPAASSHRGLVITILILALLAGGSGAGYYYWMNAKMATVTPQAINVATSTQDVATTSTQTAVSINNRPALESSINAMDAALATGTYDDFLKVVTLEGSNMPTKDQFTKNLSVLKNSLTIDLSKTNFVKIDQSGNIAGYYYTTTKTDATTAKSKPQSVNILGMVKFVSDNGTWKITKLYTETINDPTKAEEQIAAHKEFSLTLAATSTSQSITPPSGKY